MPTNQDQKEIIFRRPQYKSAIMNSIMINKNMRRTNLDMTEMQVKNFLSRACNMDGMCLNYEEEHTIYTLLIKMSAMSTSLYNLIREVV